jgi:DNA polymerase-3 subunit delta
MIIKSYNADNLKLNSNFFLFYGKNEGLKKQIINNLLKNKKEISSYDEREILENSNSFIENTLTKSLFENEKIILIKRATDKIFKIIEEISEKKIEDLIIIINSENLDKKSKLRAFFEKSKKYICIAVFPDNNQTLAQLTLNFFKQKKILISQQNIYFIVNKCNGDRDILENELKKIEHFSKNKKEITFDDLIKLINLSENHGISELIDNCLAKNQKKTLNILNENIFTSEDCILIIRTFLNKSKRILKLCNEFENNKNIETTISSAKPPIFWKDKEIVKQQIYKWKPEKIKKLIYELFEIELIVKKNLNNSVNLVTDFILDKSI